MLKELKKMDKASIVRTIVFVIALINQGLAIFNISPIPLDEGSLELFVSYAFSGVTALWVWWKNNFREEK